MKTVEYQRKLAKAQSLLRRKHVSEAKIAKILENHEIAIVLEALEEPKPLSYRPQRLREQILLAAAN